MWCSGGSVYFTFGGAIDINQGVESVGNADNAGTRLATEARKGTLGEVWHGEAGAILRVRRLIVILYGPMLARSVKCTITGGQDHTSLIRLVASQQLGRTINTRRATKGKANGRSHTIYRPTPQPKRADMYCSLCRCRGRKEGRMAWSRVG